jgi:hypothetical protein
VVVLHRVVCCYPDYERLLGAAAEHARRLLVFSYPPRNGVSRLVIAAQNLVFRLWRIEFRTFAHPPARMLAVLEERGLRRAYAPSPARLADRGIRTLVAVTATDSSAAEDGYLPRRADASREVRAAPATDVQGPMCTFRMCSGRSPRVGAQSRRADSQRSAAARMTE